MKQSPAHTPLTEAQQLRIIIVGATSGIGLSLAQQYLQAGHLVGLTGRREEQLKKIQTQFLGTAYIQNMDVSKATLAASQLETLIHTMKGADIIIISSGVGFVNPKLEWQKQSETLNVNVIGFTAIASTAMKYFLSKGKGHLVAISSIAGLQGSDIAPDYAASKAYISNYLVGLRKKSIKEKTAIIVTDIIPGFVDTAMGQSELRFWVSSSEKAAQQIIKGLNKKRKIIYITKRWRLIAWLIKIIPSWIYYRI